MTNDYMVTFGVHTSIISGYKAAYAAFHEACKLSNLMSDGEIVVALADAETGEIIADNCND